MWYQREMKQQKTAPKFQDGCIRSIFAKDGSGGRIRTYDNPINSRGLYR